MAARIAFVSPCGFGNLGDAAIIDSLVHAIRRRIPGAEIVGFTQNPADTIRRHGVPAFALDRRVREAPREEGSEAKSEPPRARPLAAARRALWKIPGMRRGLGLVSEVRAERRFRVQVESRMRDLDTVVIAGGGQLDDFWGGAFRHPYAVWQWGRLAKRHGARYVVLSVGTGSLAPLSRLFVRRALALADYRSFRDRRSRELVGDDTLTAGDPVVPDLAYGLPEGAVAPAPRSASLVVGVSPMAYADPRVWPERDAERYRRHVATLVDVSARALQAGHEVVLFATDGMDHRSLDDLRERLSPELRQRVRVPPVTSVGELMQTLAGVDVVVAARLHGVLLSHVAGRPALALSHERKVATLMDDTGQPRFCLEMDDGPDRAWDRFQELAARREELAAQLRQKVAGFRRSVELQYDRVFGPPRG